MKTNKKEKSEPVFTHEGTKAVKTSDYQSLRRSVLASLLWENSAYEDGVSISERIAGLIPKVNPELVSKLAIEARTKFKLRHMPLFMVREMARHEAHKAYVEHTLFNVIQRADELTEALAIFWKEGKTPIASSFKRGLAKAFTKFSEENLAKYNQDNKIKLRDVLFLTHAKPIDKAQAKVWKKLVNNELQTPDTWEVMLSATGGESKKEAWERLLKQEKLGALALLRNLRNFKENGVNEKLIVNALQSMSVERVLPFRFIAAARYYPGLESVLEQAMFKCLDESSILPGRTALVIDTSPSMWMHKISSKSDMDRFEAASALTILLREICESVKVYAFNNKAYEIPNRRGFALRDSLAATKNEFSCGSLAIDMANNDGYDRIICLTDGQWHSVKDGKPQKGGLIEGTVSQSLKGSKAYMLNVSNEQYGVSVKGNWHNLDGFSEAVITYIQEIENFEAD